MTFGRTVKITGEQVNDIFARLQPHMPRQFRKVEPSPSGWGFRFEFAEFTGREERPSMPRSFFNDPKLTYVSESDDPAEHLLREVAGQILSDIYEDARKRWEEADYVADLRHVVKDAPDRWRAYERARKELESAYGYLRTPEAAREWMAALSRLVDAQDRALAAAKAFDERGQEIAEIHNKHRYADLWPASALKAAGYPEADDWHIASSDYYHLGYHFSGSTDVPLTEIVRRMVEEQDAHVAKVGCLAGTTPAAN
ncbi:hypothetical protein [Streptomyces sp. NPDC048192]|uniref:hypothetical protein n=1 Tax=Streptomyces sp. NPDC048192 TaxID=3365510 RepID=UPI003712CE73